VILVALKLLMGCSDATIERDSWYTKCDWQAEKFFDDPQLREACSAIESRDITRIEQLISSGADVNAKGKDGMTLLMWAYAGETFQIFSLLLKHGADPDVAVTSDLNTNQFIRVGDSVSVVAAKSRLEYLKAALENNGNANLVSGRGDSLLHLAIRGVGLGKQERIQCLLDHGADINALSREGDVTPAMAAVTWGGQYDIALFLLQAGADFRKYRENQPERLIHYVLADNRRNPTGKQKVDYERLLTFLKDNGESEVMAQREMDQWIPDGPMTPTAIGKLRQRAVAERKRRDAGSDK